jgi:hypothetical protein
MGASQSETKEKVQAAAAAAASTLAGKKLRGTTPVQEKRAGMSKQYYSTGAADSF